MGTEDPSLSVAMEIKRSGEKIKNKRLSYHPEIIVFWNVFLQTFKDTYSYWMERVVESVTTTTTKKICVSPVLFTSLKKSEEKT